MKVIAAGLTNVGMKRDHNEDNLLLYPEENVYVVADGMGGHAAGEVASQIAVDTISEFFKNTSADEEVTWPYKENHDFSYVENRLQTAVRYANRLIYETALADKSKHGMGTTVVSIVFTNKGAYTGHAGDSRAYRFRDGQVEPVTVDHSLLNDYMRAHALTPEEIEAFPHKNVITRAVGMKEDVEVEVGKVELRSGDIYMLCSDGLNGEITDDEMNEIVQRFVADPAKCDDVEGMCTELIAAANAGGGKDNVTCICMKVVD